MKQLLILSGKGGTGKTTIASALIKLSHCRAYADCDVDAPNLHLLMQHSQKPHTTDFLGLKKAKINYELCINCGLCLDKCKFEAIIYEDCYKIDHYACEGCSVCQRICPVGAISMFDSKAGDLMLYDKDDIFSTAELKMGSGNSGKLVTEVKKQMKNALKGNYELAIIDGSPGIGCPVIASINGVDLVFVVAEPSISGISDMERIIKTSQIFQTEVAICINKYDVNLDNTQKIIKFCSDNNLRFIGTIPFDKDAINAVNNGLSIVDVDCISGSAIREIYKNLISLIYDKGENDL